MDLIRGALGDLISGIVLGLIIFLIIKMLT
jgi:hypothetical protein